MTIVRLRLDDTWEKFVEDWTTQCDEIGERFDDYATSSVNVIKQLTENEVEDQWAIALKNDNRFMAIAAAIRTTQKGFTGKVLRIREVTVCPLLDYGNLPESDYSGTLIGLLDGAVKLSERDLRAKHIKLHLRSPYDANFFRAVGNTLDSKGVFEATEAHGAWLSFTKHANLKAV